MYKLLTTVVTIGALALVLYMYKYDSLSSIKDETQKLDAATDARQDKLSNAAVIGSDSNLLSTNYIDNSSTTQNSSQLTASSFTKVRQNFIELIQSQDFSGAIDFLNRVHQQANSEQLSALKKTVLANAENFSQAGEHELSVKLLSEYTQDYKEVEALRLLAQVAEKAKLWSVAVDTYIESIRLENDDHTYQEGLNDLVRASSYVRAQRERQGDELGILALYKRVYAQYPNHARFALELAQSHLRLGDNESALPFLRQIQYDPELGAIATQKLAQIEIRLSEKKTANSTQSAIPLHRVGTSFIATVAVNNSQIELLLDTGASITALARSSIRQLGLKPTTQFINLSTANGVRRAALFNAEHLSLGGRSLKNVVIAEIEIAQDSPFKGLLGTDVLAQLAQGSNYLIDNQNSKLIFLPK